ncbi:ATP-binding protein [Pyrinomonas sp.]|uniref:sensor histidine kinase n=1 Tax=Pyrinomonas sp. TaxID=2080306 RepID=UPI00332B85D2
MSLRTKLLVLTAVSFISSSIAFASAWRALQTSYLFAVRQVEQSVAQAAREIAREATGGEKPRPAGRPLPPHEREIRARFADEPTRAVARALHRMPETSGGLCRAEGALLTAVSADTKSAALSPRERQASDWACRQAVASQGLQVAEAEFGGERFAVAFQPLAEDEERTSSAAGVFAFRPLPRASLFADPTSLLMQAVSLVLAAGLALFSFSTWREWQCGMRRLEQGLDEIARDLGARIEPPTSAELGAVSRAINKLAADLEAKRRREAELERSLARSERLASLGRVAAGIAHEVRNPLASMKLKVQLASRGEFARDKLERTFVVLLEEIERLDALVQKLLDLSRPPCLELSRCAISSLASERLALIADRCARGGVEVVIERAPEAETVIEADSAKLAQALDNLLLNGLEAMAEGGVLRVSVVADSKHVRVAVADTGPGIAPEAREKIFEPFFTTKEKGTGLGLAITREIVEAHGGRIFLDEAGGSTAFVIELPKPPRSD